MANRKHQLLKKNRAKIKAEITLHSSGRLIEENHNGQNYSPEYTKKVIAWRFYELWMKTKKYQNNPDELYKSFGRLKEGLQKLLIHWPDDSLKRGPEFWLIYDLLNVYRQGDIVKLSEILKNAFNIT